MRRNGKAAGDNGKGGGGGTMFVTGEGTTTVVRVKTTRGWRMLGSAHSSVKETSEGLVGDDQQCRDAPWMATPVCDGTMISGVITPDVASPWMRAQNLYGSHQRKMRGYAFQEHS
ncbi:hypothetical protein U1Q18_006712 [Sarracenia purpurea var. burkii]